MFDSDSDSAVLKLSFGHERLRLEAWERNQSGSVPARGILPRTYSEHSSPIDRPTPPEPAATGKPLSTGG